MTRPRTTDDLFGDRLIAIREARGWSQSQVARLAGMHQSAISKIEAHKRTVSLTEAFMLSDALRVSLDEMVRPGQVTVVTVS